jgi:hypothetical protein
MWKSSHGRATKSFREGEGEGCSSLKSFAIDPKSCFFNYVEPGLASPEVKLGFAAAKLELEL